MKPYIELGLNSVLTKYVNSNFQILFNEVVDLEKNDK